MSAIWRSFDAPQLSDDLRDGLRRRLRELGGLAMLGVTAGLGVALATWSAQDPSLTHATNGPIRNLAGLPGAVAADLMMQIFGLASISLIAPVAVWGWRLLSRRSIDRERLRLSAWLIGIFAAAMFASCLPPTPGWPLPTGLGGVLGDMLLRLPALMLGPPLTMASRVAVGSLAALVTFTCLFAASGFGLKARSDGEMDGEVDDEGDTGETRGWFLG